MTHVKIKNIITVKVKTMKKQLAVRNLKRILANELLKEKKQQLESCKICYGELLSDEEKSKNKTKKSFWKSVLKRTFSWDFYYEMIYPPLFVQSLIIIGITLGGFIVTTNIGVLGWVLILSSAILETILLSVCCEEERKDLIKDDKKIEKEKDKINKIKEDIKKIERDDYLLSQKEKEKIISANILSAFSKCHDSETMFNLYLSESPEIKYGQIENFINNTEKLGKAFEALKEKELVA